MIKGDLVWLNHNLYYEYDEHIGIIIKISNKKILNNIGQLEHVIDVMWSSGIINTYYEHELELIKNESR